MEPMRGDSRGGGTGGGLPPQQNRRPSLEPNRQAQQGAYLPQPSPHHNSTTNRYPPGYNMMPGHNTMPPGFAYPPLGAGQPLTPPPYHNQSSSPGQPQGQPQRLLHMPAQQQQQQQQRRTSNPMPAPLQIQQQQQQQQQQQPPRQGMTTTTQNSLNQLQQNYMQQLASTSSARGGGGGSAGGNSTAVAPATVTNNKTAKGGEAPTATSSTGPSHPSPAAASQQTGNGNNANKNDATQGGPNNSTMTATSTNTTTQPTSNGKTAARPGLPPLPAIPPEQVPNLLAQCSWPDQTLWVARQLLGGQAMNGFLRSTANAQRLKRQRARAVKKDAEKKVSGDTNEKEAGTSNSAAATTTTAAAAADTSSQNNSNNKKRSATDISKFSAEQQEEEAIKPLVMNARTAKKIKAEMQVGLKFCERMHTAICGILTQLQVPGVIIPAPLGPELPVVPADRVPSLQRMNNKAGSTKSAATPATPLPLDVPGPITNHAPLVPASPVAKAGMLLSQESPGKLSAPAVSRRKSTLRKSRRKKVPPSQSLDVGIAEVDANGKRLLSKKEYTQRVFEVIRFRALRPGDHVAARLSSRDLWILARVTQAYPAGHKLPPMEFLQLSVAKRDALFRDKVLLHDVEDKDSASAPTTVARNLVLPLPRNYGEAAEWGSHYRKGSRVYAMYPETTSLYTATVVDNTTYAQGDDDIIVVQFDGEEPEEATGAPPQCHIPSRFVCLIPREFPAYSEKPTSSRKASALPVAPSRPSNAGISKPHHQFSDPMPSLDLALNQMEGLEGFDDLDFDLGLGDS